MIKSIPETYYLESQENKEVPRKNLDTLMAPCNTAVAKQQPESTAPGGAVSPPMERRGHSPGKSKGHLGRKQQN